MESTEEKIKSEIEKKIRETKGYGGEFRDYIYAEHSQDLFVNLMYDVACSTRSRIGGISLKVCYWDEKGIQKEDRGEHLLTPFIGQLGCFGALGMCNFENDGKPVFSEEELQTFKNEINQVMPYKYKPIFGKENEIRLLYYFFDGENSDEITISLEDSVLNCPFKKGHYRGRV